MEESSLSYLSGEIKGAVRYKNLEFRKLEIGIWNWVKVVNGDADMEIRSVWEKV